jgi:hypothetical protein
MLSLISDRAWIKQNGLKIPSIVYPRMDKAKLCGKFSKVESPAIGRERPTKKQPSIITSLLCILLGTNCTSHAPNKKLTVRETK